jgi:hypothetical protein
MVTVRILFAVEKVGIATSGAVLEVQRARQGDAL